MGKTEHSAKKKLLTWVQVVSSDRDKLQLSVLQSKPNSYRRITGHPKLEGTQKDK